MVNEALIHFHLSWFRNCRVKLFDLETLFKVFILLGIILIVFQSTFFFKFIVGFVEDPSLLTLFDSEQTNICYWSSRDLNMTKRQLLLLKRGYKIIIKTSKLILNWKVEFVLFYYLFWVDSNYYDFLLMLLLFPVRSNMFLDQVFVFLMHFLFLNRIETNTFEIVSMAEPST